MINCFHGLVGDASNWERLLDRLPIESNQLYAPDIDYRHKSLQEIIYETSNILNGSSNAVAVGNSLGCLVALGVGDKVSEIILTGPPHKFNSFPIRRDDASIDEYVSNLAFSSQYSDSEMEMKKEISRKLKSVLCSREGIQWLKKVKKEITEFNTFDLMLEYQKKIHFVIGSEDKITPHLEFENFARNKFPLAKFTLINNCGHAVPIEQPKKLANIIDGYINA